jgi:hypothetical protein
MWCCVTGQVYRNILKKCSTSIVRVTQSKKKKLAQWHITTCHQNLNPHNFHSAHQGKTHTILFSSHEYTGTTITLLEMLRRDAELLSPPMYSWYSTSTKCWPMNSVNNQWELSPCVKQPRCEGLLNPMYVEVRNKWNHTSTPVCTTSCCIHGLLPQPITCCPSNK